MSPWQKENTAIMEAVFSTRFVPRGYKQGQLAGLNLVVVKLTTVEVL
jgi:hypothetical protein